jgi:dipeptidyl aminopeptidase/acylaminoacyl peptidase
MNLRLTLTLFLFALTLSSAPAQGTAADYQRAKTMQGDLMRHVLRGRIEERWKDGKLFYKVKSGENQDEYVRVDPADGKRELIKAEEMPPAQPGEREGQGRGRGWGGRRSTGGPGSGFGPGSASPDGKWQAVIRDNNVWLRNNEGNEERQLSTDGNAGDAFRRPLIWSPDSKFLACVREKPAQEHKVSMIVSSPKDQLQPRVMEHNYLKPGDKIAQAKPVVFEIEGRRPRTFTVGDDVIPNPWSIERLRWSPDSQRLTFQYNQRGHQVFRLMEINAADEGKVRTVVDESTKTFIDYTNKIWVHHLDATRELLWMSERDGWNHLYLFDEATGTMKKQITQGQWVVRSVLRVDEAVKQIWFLAGGVVSGQDFCYKHLCRVNFDGTGFTVLTKSDGTHEVRFSPDNQFFVDRWSRVDCPPVHELRRSSDGSLVCELERANLEALFATGWKYPERFSAKGRDGVTDIDGVIYRPSNFDASKKYPVIEEIYAGPHDQFVPKAFGTQSRQHSIAELGFIVVQIDGMGTNWRSRAFHDVCWQNLGDSGFPDRIAWMKAAAGKEPAMDLTRVGIYGGSAGGQSALRAMLAFGDFYKAAAADCGCHDNRMDKIWWNEQWMGWPIGKHYEEQSNVTQAHRLTGKLLLTVGENDTNVDPASTMQVVNALIKADKDFELIVVPGANHGIGESPYCARRRMDFFVRNLLGAEPRR